MDPAKGPVLIAIVGGSGAGKSWLARRLAEGYGKHACQISLDSFYKDQGHLPADERDRINFDVPSAIDWGCAERALRNCRLGQPFLVPNYDFRTHCISGHAGAFIARPLVIVEGLWLLLKGPVRQLFDLSLYLDCPRRVRRDRRIARDARERGRRAEAIEEQFHRVVAPMHECYVEPQRRLADIVLRYPLSSDQLDLVAARLKDLTGLPVSPSVGLPSLRDESMLEVTG